MKIKKRIINPPKPTTRKKKSSIPTAMEYITLFNTCEIKKEKILAVDKIIDEKVVVNRQRYESVSNLVKGNNVSSQSLNQPFQFQSPYTPFYNRFGQLTGNTDTSVAQKSLLTPPSFDLNNSPMLASRLLQPSFTDNSSAFGLNRDMFSLSSVFSSAGVPWYFIACVHYLECSFSFKKHLHNGDPLTGYTVHVPAHRPKVGHAPPFTFEESAVDALKLMKYDQVTNWSLPFILQKLEGYNGFGYNKKGVHTPYLWSFSNHYTKGKYVKDGVFDANAVSQQLGAAVILKRMEQRALISIPRN
ncbi:hypothetical protein KHS38_20175 [Mucilaginibacter sp. Bleaf8]|uniref:hypothetical protein n=1 Tax=Mucilaginibacter sp. Bleaf8 TaxID=2834430 RepID=UPI001BCCCD61|nr:hypothetical protein [Mucilaginibacter sp. Bleaf8]MBS7566733.1 hypothetical protein [Mucilaginibacter sp. Bleaf8]